MTTLHLVSHTHWDREWYRTFQQFRLRLVHLVDHVLDLLENDRQFKYFMLDGQTIVIDDYLLMRPENEERLRRLVRSGRLVIGPWHILPDEFLVSPEATIRNLLAGDRTCRRFGPRMEIGYIPDPFGHIGQMPQILQGFAIQSACVQRGLSDERCEFWWEAPDGSRVFMAYLRDGYGNAAGLPAANPEHFASEVRRLRDSLLPHSNSGRNLLLMHGTDHMEPPIETSRAISFAKGKLDGDELVHSTLNDYLTAVKSALRGEHIPTVRGELRDCKRSHLLPGVLSTRMWIKQANWQCENKLEKWAEPFTTLAGLVTADRHPSHAISHPANILRQAWQLLMECHPHDSICGCSIDQVHDEMKPRFDQVNQICDDLVGQSLENLASVVTTSPPTKGTGAEQAVVVFNPLSFVNTCAVQASIETAAAFDLLDESGNKVPFQEQGLGSHELVHAVMTPKELQSLYVNVHDGRVMGMSVQKIDLERSGDTILLDATVSECRPPILSAWEKAITQIEALMTDPSIKSFRIRAVSADTSRITFTASDVPSLGWKTYWIHPRPELVNAPAEIPPLARLFLPLARLSWVQRLIARPHPARPPYRIGNEFLLVEARPDGTLTLTDKTTGRQATCLNRFLDGGDCGDEYNYCPPPQDTLVPARLKKVEIKHGHILQEMTLHLELPAPASLSPDRKTRTRRTSPIQITCVVRLTAGVPRLEFQTNVRNLARDHRLRVHFPAPFPCQSALYDGHYEFVERKIGLPQFDATWVEQPRPEVPQRAFTSISNQDWRLTLANRGLPEVETMLNSQGNAEVALTLLRCVGWLSRDDFDNRKGHAGPFLETPGAQLQGDWQFEYALIVGSPEIIPAIQSAYAYETPMQAVATGLHPGSLPSCGAFLTFSPSEFVLSAIKETEDGKGWIARGYNTSASSLQLEIQPWQSFKKVVQVNLAEEKKTALRPSREDGKITLPVRGKEIVTLRFEN